MISVLAPSVLPVSDLAILDPIQPRPEVCNKPGEKPIRLSPSEHSWPNCFTAAVSKVLDDAGIPNFLWGDLLNSWRGNPHMANICGFVVSTEDFQRATHVITTAGLPVCSCEDFLHQSNPDSMAALPVHFSVPQWCSDVLLFLCPNDSLLNLIPLTSAHANPASLQYDRIRLSLHDTWYSPHVDNNAVDSTSSLGETHVVNVLTTSSLIKAWLLLDVLSAPHRVGIVYEYSFLLHIMPLYATPSGPYDFESESLQAMWQKVYIDGDWCPETYEILQNEVKLEWQGRILDKGSLK
ncbi:hypothetical protein A0H81_06952 [Grifola frondosa]|uniref:Uncharacterized protein n=1 Tax=Grifola frondosa TaxID=5627 RepID=A0A1C7M8P4_GRIFR|nr:hypothetical protein A0H81_06952 [Grifola frondosa]